MEYIRLNNGVEMPKLGLGVFQMTDEQVAEAVPAALDAGYRLIDTASRYYNEKALGAALDKTSVPREELFITTKLWFKDHGYEQTKTALQVSLDNLGLDYLDLYLIHQPFGDYYGAWRAMEDLLDEGKIRAIGVSNFFPDRYLDLVVHNRVVPAVNQRETHPFNQQIDMHDLAAKHGTILQAWSPLAQGNPEVLNDPTLTAIAQAHGKTLPQVILRWLIQRDIPRRRQEHPRAAAAREHRGVRLPAHRRRDGGHRGTRPRPIEHGVHPPGPPNAGASTHPPVTREEAADDVVSCPQLGSLCI
ncbi:aldo/keto reductase [Nonomuraea sp. NPDC050451]|uniref:aldo/keto reductase n=1 Tax=Nonomuraea sp. NPDC050451 TaxID=3364364 RepID=UPI0037AF8249